MEDFTYWVGSGSQDIFGFIEVSAGCDIDYEFEMLGDATEHEAVVQYEEISPNELAIEFYTDD